MPVSMRAVFVDALESFIMATETSSIHRTVTHWGAYDAEVVKGQIVALHPIADDPDPSPIGNSLVDAVAHPNRIAQPMIRKGWLENGPQGAKGGRGSDPFVSVSWDRALDLAARELDRVRQDYGNESIYAGSYGWASAGRFHHAQSQIHRFMNMIGGYSYSVNSYSIGAAEVILPHVIGTLDGLSAGHTTWPVIAEHSDLVVMFGGIPLKNSQVNMGGMGRHTVRDWLKRCHENGVDFVNISPNRQDADVVIEAEWIAPHPNTDTALMLGLAHTLMTEKLHDEAFLVSHATGFDRFAPYLMGETDSQPKSAEWAASITGIDADDIRALARRMAGGRTMITMAWSLQRADHGEQPYWMAVTLAAMLGQIGLPGGGFGFGYGAVSAMGNPTPAVPMPALPQGKNPVSSYIPVARIAEMLTNPGATIDYDGKRITLPHARVVYWCGGNPFHHHQDLNRFVEAWQQPDTVIVHEPWWNSLARHADIVFPATTTMERNDIGASSTDNAVFPMHKVVERVGDSRDDYEIFGGLAERLGVQDMFTENRTEEEWLRYLYNQLRQRAAQRDVQAPEFEEFWEAGKFTFPASEGDRVLFSDFRGDPDNSRLNTPSGKVEIFSSRIAGFGYDNCPGHAVWREPYEWLGAKAAGRYPLHMISNQPKTRLHSQLDLGKTAQDSKIKGREPALIHPDDAAARGISDGDVIRVFNERGACLAGAVLTNDIRAGVLQLQTGAWYDPELPGGMDRHGNPNVLTRDEGTSKLAQGSTAQSALVQIERFDGELPPIGAYTPPEIIPEHAL